jgi:tetratricopeptide (TPR) repeat protein
MDRFPKPTVRRAWFADGLVAFALAVIALDVVRHGLSRLALTERTGSIDGPSGLVATIEPMTALLESSGALVLAAVVAGVSLFVRIPRAARLLEPRRMVLLIVAASILLDVGRYAHWATHRKYSIVEIQRAIPTIVSEDAVLVGPFAAILTQDSPLAAISWIDPIAADDALERLRPTHRVEDERSDALGFDESLPASIAAATSLVTWPFRTPNVRSITLSRVGGATPTAFENAVEAMNRGEWSTALTLLREQEATHGPTPDGLFKQATCAFETGDVPAAGALLRRAVELRPDSPLYWFNLGMVAQSTGDRGAARAAWQRALQLDPDDMEPLTLLRATK